ncbi:NnrS family protein [Aquamicrobium segne]|uniref:NnrS family protein n=1 Tax=Aquamicrobium segne TaxID=469547 RepID=A0ABW0GZT6_9HYPH
MTDSAVTSAPVLPLTKILGDEGFRLFFPLGALYAALWPFQWVLVFGLDLPLAHTTPPGLWHAHEMIFGAFGAALIGFITTAVPEWTDTQRPQGKFLYPMAALWGGGRLVGFFGADMLGLAGAICDVAWLVLLTDYVVRVSVQKRSDNLLSFILWMGAFAVTEAVVRYGFTIEDAELARRALHVAGLVFLGLLGLALARITVAVTNLILDPSETTSPFRPHPGRLNLAPGLVALAIAGELAGLSPEASGYLMIAAGAAFMDRVGEAFVGREMLRSEIMVLAGSSGFAGAGLILIGCVRLGAPLAETAGLHVALMGGLGLGVLSVFSIAGLLHSGQPLVFARMTRFAALLLVAALALRVLPDLDLQLLSPDLSYAGAALLWAAAFLLWLRVYWPLLSNAATLGTRQC